MKSIDSCLNQASAETLASIQGSIHLAVVPTSLVSGEFIAVGKIHIETTGGDDGVRTHDLRLAKPALYQLSYIP